MDWQTLSAVTRFRFIFKDGSFFLFSRFWTPYDIILIHNSSSEVLYTLPGKTVKKYLKVTKILSGQNVWLTKINFKKKFKGKNLRLFRIK